MRVICWALAATLLAGCNAQSANNAPQVEPATVTVTAAAPPPMTVTAAATSSTPTRGSLSFTDPRAMVSKTIAAGVPLKDCSAPTYNIYRGLAVRCAVTEEGIREGVDFSVFDRPQDESASVDSDIRQGVKVYSGSLWTVTAFNRQATLDKLTAALLG